MKTKIGIGGDHAGYTYKKVIKEMLQAEGYEVQDFGPDSEASVDYPDYIHPLSNAIEEGNLDLGIAICGSGNGVSMTANKHKGIRAALCWNPELASLARQHNNANILSLPSRFIDITTAKQCVKSFLESSFEGGRHQKRVDKIPC
jgi:ribose 5-phosphate isomerase B